MRLLPRLKWKDKATLITACLGLTGLYIVHSNYPWLIPTITFVSLLTYFLFQSIYQNGKTINSSGYVFLINEKELEHRYIAKKILERNLEHNEVVHHINGRRKDNAASNLCVMDSEKHEHFHAYLNWCKEKRKNYPSIKEQRRILVDQYGGILLNNHKTDTFKLVKTPSDDFYSDRKQALQKQLFDDLKKARRRLAVQRGIPPYQVFYNKELTEMSEQMPETDYELIQIIGPTKFKFYGPYFLTIIRNFKAETDLQAERKDAA